MTPEERRQKRDTILTRTAQLLTRLLHERAMRRSFDENVAVAQLAIELSKLRPKTSPRAHLAEAAQLLSGAREALQTEADRPAQEHKALLEDWIAKETKQEQAARVPFNRLVRIGKEHANVIEVIAEQDSDGTVVEKLKWQVYTSLRGFRDLLQQFARRRYDEHVAAVHQLLETQPLSIESLQARLEAPSAYLWQQRGSEPIREQLQKLAYVEDVQAFLRIWRPKAEAAFADGLLVEAQAEGLRLVDLYALQVERTRANQDRAARARAAAQQARQARSRAKALVADSKPTQMPPVKRSSKSVPKTVQKKVRKSAEPFRNQQKTTQ